MRSLIFDCTHSLVNTLRPRQNDRYFPDDIFECILLKENVWIPIKVSLKFVPKGSINNIAALVQIMVWCLSGDKPLSEPIMARLLTHICVTRPQWVIRCYNCLFCLLLQWHWLEFYLVKPTCRLPVARFRWTMYMICEIQTMAYSSWSNQSVTKPTC